MNTTDHEAASTPIPHDFAAAARAQETWAVQEFRSALAELEHCLDPEVTERETGYTPHRLLGNFARSLGRLIAEEQAPLHGATYIGPHVALDRLADPDDAFSLLPADQVEVPDPGPGCPHCP
ncbi:hypothetical protein [Nocardia vaccinii]|uniref:hypothetical protein n=1 Tax=Nocardia vaccinii TaxID=1822 RepID=UPI00082FDBC5|nr:hypothetical protein [Nocardia vaccinii]